MEKIIKLSSHREAQTLFGNHDENIEILEKKFNVRIFASGENLKVRGRQENIKNASELINRILSETIQREGSLDKQELYNLISSTKDKDLVLKKEKIDIELKGKEVNPKTKAQAEYVEAIKHYDIVFCIGPAGTGKTYLAVAMAVEALKKGYVRRIVLTRPAIEAGENLGFLPGDMHEKILPYLRPLYDALYSMMDADKIEKYNEMGIIEMAPLAYMRGRTLNDAFVILDEAQNCTTEQMKMFLTRLGFDSKTVITGDITQSDLPGGRPSGLLQAQQILEDLEGIKFAYLSGADVVRHELVQRIIEAYATVTKK